MNYEHFPNAPITEALLDIRVELPTTTTTEQLEEFGKRVTSTFPRREQRQTVTAQFRLSNAGIGADRKEAVDGFFFWNADRTRAVQARLDGFTVNHLKPYDRWETLRDNGKSLWKHYLELARPSKVTRLGLRYINRIELPLPVDELGKYLKTCPVVGVDPTDGLSGYDMRVWFIDPDTKANTILSQRAFAPTPDVEAVPIVFDIDVSLQVELSADAEEVWQDFERLHDVKNRMFFNSITDDAKELFR